jgi:hypothetical protein
MLSCLVLAVAVTVPCGTLLAANPVPVDLGTAADFGVLAGAAITGSGDVEGDVGSGTGAIAPAITSSGIIYSTGDAAVMTALNDFAIAYNDGLNRPYDSLLSAAAYELGGKTLTPGVYKIGAAATLASPVTLNAKGDPDAVFIIQIGGALGTTAAVGNVVLMNGARSANIFWIVEGAVSMGASTCMEGTLLGGATLTFGADTTISGQVMAGSAAGTIALSTTIVLPVEPSVVGDRIWFDSNGDGIQDLTETTGIANVPVSLMQIVYDDLPIDLGTAANFGALAGGAISGTGDVEGDVGSGAGAIALDITSEGTIYPTGDAAVMNALADYSKAYNNGKNRTYDVLLSAAAYDLGGDTLTSGVYKIGAATTMSSPVTLDAEGDSDAVFIIQIGGAFSTTASIADINLTNAAQSANVFWIVEGAVALGASSHIEGTLLGGASIGFGVNATINGRALAGKGVSAITFSTTTISEVIATSPVEDQTLNVVADTVTDANGNYLFGSVQPGTYVVRWDLSSFTSNVGITTAKQGGDDALDSDGVSGDVGGFVYTTEIEVLGGITNLNLDLGLVETLAAVKAAAIDDLATALATYLEENYYTFENWTTLKTAKTDGDSAINAATDPAGVAMAKNSALTAMEAVPTIPETPTFTDISRTPEGEVTLVVRTTPDLLLTLQTSTDLNSWTTIATATPVTELWTFVHDAELATGPKRFYRAFLNP